MLYLDYFQELQKTLHEQGNGQPQLILDLSKLEQNIDWLQHKMPTHLKPRLVVKSLANSILLKRIAKAFNTQSLWCSIFRMRSISCKPIRRQIF